MKKLEELGFIETVSAGIVEMKYVVLRHPTIVVQELKEAGKVDEDWWNAYRAMKREVGEPLYEEVLISQTVDPPLLFQPAQRELVLKRAAGQPRKKNR